MWGGVMIENDWKMIELMIETIGSDVSISILIPISNMIRYAWFP